MKNEKPAVARQRAFHLVARQGVVRGGHEAGHEAQ